MTKQRGWPGERYRSSMVSEADRGGGPAPQARAGPPDGIRPWGDTSQPRRDMTAERLDWIGHDALPRIGSVATGHTDVLPNWLVVRVPPGCRSMLESQRGDVTAAQRSPAARRRSAR